MFVHSCKKEAWKLSHCHGNITVFIMRFITGAKFQLQCLYISWDILDFVICLHAITTDGVIT